MNISADLHARSPFSHGSNHIVGQRNIPILPSLIQSSESPQGDPMEVTLPGPAMMGPPMHSSPDMDQGGPSTTNGHGEVHANNTVSSTGLGASAAAAAQQPKVVQTAFIHKLYNMLEDPQIQHLISWSTTNESFVMSPSNEFSKVLAQYFKHTNISSFVRQLNMYGFHKVSDVFHTGSPESPLWEFKHGNGNFKRGDLVGLREIKRRASRHALIHRDSFTSNHKPSVSQPGTPAEPLPEHGDARLANLEHSLYDMHSRLARTEENYSILSSRCQALSEALGKCHQYTFDISHYLLNMIPDPDSQMHHDVFSMHKEIGRQNEMIRALEDPHESLLSGRQPYFSNITLDPAPLSPRQVAQDDHRKPPLLGGAPRPSFFRPPVPSHLTNSPRRYGSIGAANTVSSYHRSAAHPPHPPPQHPLASASSPPGANLARRHTSADIRLPGWPGHGAASPLASGQSSAHWPSSPNQTASHGDQHVRDVLAQYEMGGSRASFASRQPTPPLTSDTTPSTLSAESGSWSFGGGSKFPSRSLDISAPATRRSSMASNVHSLLNPADTAERGVGAEDSEMSEDRKRKRLQ